MPRKKNPNDTEKIDLAIADAARSISSGQKLSDAAAEFIRSHCNDPGWEMWVQAEVVAIVHDRMRSYIRSDRASAMADHGIDRFKDATTGPVVSKFDVRYCINEDNEWKPLRDMKKDDLLFVANDYRQREASNRMEALFFEALAKKVGRKTVGTAFVNSQALEGFRQELQRPAA